MSTTPTGASGTPKKKKNQPAPSTLVKAVGALFDIAAQVPQPLQLQSMARDKLYEMLVLARLLVRFTARDGDRVLVEVGDTGVGIPEHLQGKVFVDHLSQLKQTRIKTKLAKQARESA